jgi:hypothetical protein
MHDRLSQIPAHEPAGLAFGSRFLQGFFGGVAPVFILSAAVATGAPLQATAAHSEADRFTPKQPIVAAFTPAPAGPPVFQLVPGHLNALIGRVYETHSEPDPVTAKQPVVGAFTAPPEPAPVWPLSPDRMTAGPDQAVRAVEAFGLDPRSQLLTALTPAAPTGPAILQLLQGHASDAPLSQVLAAEPDARADARQPSVGQVDAQPVLSLLPQWLNQLLLRAYESFVEADRETPKQPKLDRADAQVQAPSIAALSRGRLTDGPSRAVEAHQEPDRETPRQPLVGFVDQPPVLPLLPGHTTLDSLTASQAIPIEEIERARQPVVGRVDAPPTAPQLILLLQGQVNSGSLGPVASLERIQLETGSRLSWALIPAPAPSGPPIRLLVSDQFTAIEGGQLVKVKPYSRPEPEPVGLILGPFEEVRAPAVIPLLPGRLNDQALTANLSAERLQVELRTRTIAGFGEPPPPLPPIVVLLAGYTNVRGPLAATLAQEPFERIYTVQPLVGRVDAPPVLVKQPLPFTEADLPRPPLVSLGRVDAPPVLGLAQSILRQTILVDEALIGRLVQPVVARIDQVVSGPPVIILLPAAMNSGVISAAVGVELIQLERGPRTITGAGAPTPPVPSEVLAQTLHLSMGLKIR